jgi:hypothetical protein
MGMIKQSGMRKNYFNLLLDAIVLAAVALLLATVFVYAVIALKIT